MRLINRNQSVPGGFWYKVPETGENVKTDGSFEKLLTAVEGYYTLQQLPIPDYLRARIEDQICSRIPEKYCRYTKGIGDLISRAVSAAAGVIDKVAGTNLKQRARGCGGCGRRRQKLNRNAE